MWVRHITHGGDESGAFGGYSAGLASDRNFSSARSHPLAKELHLSRCILSPRAAPMVTTQLSLDQYLRSSYRPDCDYVAGELEERNVGEKEHSAVQAFFVKWFAAHEEEYGLEAYPEIRIKISP